MTLILLKGDGLIFRLAGPPQQEGDTQRGESHHCEGCPVEHMSGELSVVVPGGDDDSLARVRGQSSQEGGPAVAAVGRLGRGEVKVAELLGSDHHGLRAVGAGCDPVQLVLELATDHVKVIPRNPLSTILTLVAALSPTLN